MIGWIQEKGSGVWHIGALAAIGGNAVATSCGKTLHGELRMETGGLSSIDCTVCRRECLDARRRRRVEKTTR